MKTLKQTNIARSLVPSAALLLGAASLMGCLVTSHPAGPAQIGVARSSSELEAVIDQPGPVVVETVDAAAWEVPLSGLLNLDDPKAEAAGLEDAPEAIHIYFHALRHPERGLYIIDTGVEKALYADPESAAIRGFVGWAMNLDKMRIRNDTATWLAAQPEPLAGVFFTHLHLDHISGARDVPKGTPLYSGPGETSATAFLNMFVKPSADRAFEGQAPVSELGFTADPDKRFAGVLDLFGDKSVWALWTPGHTPGSVAYVARTPKGPVLFAGDTCHTAWGWEHEVEPGEYTADHEQNAASLHALRRLAERHPAMDVRLGHQELPAKLAASVSGARL